MNFNYKLGIGPMSSQVIKSVFEYSHEKNIPLMLIASKNQIDWDGGYVNNWKTSQFMEYINKMRKQYFNANVLICRDHCGPGFKTKSKKLDDVYKTIENDISLGFDLIHIDLCHLENDIDFILKETEKIINYATKLNPKILIEIGTDENTGKNFKDLNTIEKELKFLSKYKEVVLYVVQTGSLVKEINQVGTFNKDYVFNVKKLTDKYNIKLKEHNVDYSGKEELNMRKNIVDAINIAPCMGVIQNIFTLAKCSVYGIDTNNFLNKSYESKKWEKWLYTNKATNKYLCSIIAGHYNFTEKSYEEIYTKLNQKENFENTLLNELKNSIDYYYKNI